jgi:hypothetical protein
LDGLWDPSPEMEGSSSADSILTRFVGRGGVAEPEASGIANKVTPLW